MEEKTVPVIVYSDKNGLKSNNVLNVMQDKNGFVWVATRKGLSRFDSKKFINYTKNKADTNAIPDVFVEQLLLMPNNDIALSINEFGLSIFDQNDQKFTSFKNSTSDLFDLPKSNLFGMSLDNSENLWLSFYGKGIYQWNPQSQKLIRHTFEDNDAWLTSKKTYELFVDSKNRLWISTIDSLVIMRDLDSGATTTFNFSIKKDDPLSSPIYAFTESANHEVFIGGYSGVFKFNEHSNKFDTVIQRDEFIKRNDDQKITVISLHIDSQDNMWIGTTHSLFQYSQNKLFAINFFENGSLVAFDEFIHSIIEGYDGNIWIGVDGLGLVKIANNWEQYKIYSNRNTSFDSLHNSYQFSKNVWVAYKSSTVLDLYNYDGDNLKYVRTLKPELIEPTIYISGILQEVDDVLWLSSLDGINKVDVLTGKSVIVKNEQGKKLGSVRQIFRGKDRKFYFNLFSENGLSYFNEEQMIAHDVKSTDGSRFMGNDVYQISQGIDEKIWFASSYGIETYDVDKGVFDAVYVQEETSQPINSFYINGEVVWAISGGSLIKLLWNGKGLVVQEDKFDEILPFIQFKKIKLIKNNTIMISTNDSGIVELDLSTRKYKRITNENGLPSSSIIDVLFLDETPLIVTEFGMALLKKDFKELKTVQPKLIIDSIELRGKKIKGTSNETLMLNHDYGTLNFEVILLAYKNSSNVEYEYKLGSTTSEWINTANDNKYSFLNISSGSYQFSVRGRVREGMWSNIASYSFVVKPPPWKTVWAYVLYGIMLASLLYWLMYLYKRKILYEHEISKEQAQKELANAASKAKSEFLARVSHEVRTPLNGVLGMGELMQDTHLNEEQKIYADSIISSGKHLLDIINDILDLSKIEARKLELEMRGFNLLDLVDEIVCAFASQAKQKKLLFTCNFDAKTHQQRIGDAIRIKQILFNLLSNAFKFTTKGEVVLSVKEGVNDFVVFTIQDTGIGINDEATQDIFMPFVQADSAITRKFGGTGLGLAIVKQLVEKMDGNIKVLAQPDKGSTFTLNVKLTKANHKPKKLNLSRKSVCLIIQQASMKQSMVNYCALLNIEYTETISSQKDCIFIDILSKTSQKQDLCIKQAVKNGVHINFIGYDFTHIEHLNMSKKMACRLLTPPITFSKLINELSITTKESQQTKDENNTDLASVSLKLLVVEDNIINQQVSIEMLEKLGHVVDVVDNAEESLTMLARNNYDMLLLDYHLPGMDGFSMLGSWRNIKNIPVIMVTADLTDEVYKKCKDHSIAHLVAKPFTLKQLSKAINKAMG